MATKSQSSLVMAAALAALLSAHPAAADDREYGRGPLVGGYFPGPMGYGMGMMHGYGGYGMGMMRGWGGQGMMHGWGGRGALDALDLTDDQRAKIDKIQDETRKTHWSFMGAMMEHQAKIRDLYQALDPDTDAIAKAYRELGELQQKMVESSLAAQKGVEALLTKEQKEKLRRYSPRPW